jgi:polysaccharide biosynthesis transport protein
VKRMPQPPFTSGSNNPILQSQLKNLDADIAKYKQEQERLNNQIATYRAKLEAIPVREQQITELSRDYQISKAHYSQLLGNQFSAETATQLEIRQKGEKFTILDPAQPAERPSSPNRRMINAAGSMAGLGLGLLLALITEFVGMSITTAEQITESTGIPVLEVIPIIQTYKDRTIRRRRLIWATASGLMCVLASCAVLFYHFRS